MEKINDTISRFDDQFFYGSPVGTYLIEIKDKVILFDLPTYSKELEQYMLSFDQQAVAVLSHGSTGIADGTKWQRKIGLTVYLHAADKDSDWLMMRPDVLFTAPPDLGTSVTIVHTPGHSLGSVCLLEQDTKVLFTGDTVGGSVESGVRDNAADRHHDDDPNLRFESCKKLLGLDFETILPFHYDTILHGAHDALQDYVHRKDSSV